MKRTKNRRMSYKKAYRYAWVNATSLYFPIIFVMTIIIIIMGLASRQ